LRSTSNFDSEKLSILLQFPFIDSIDSKNPVVNLFLTENLIALSDLTV